MIKKIQDILIIVVLVIIICYEVVALAVFVPLLWGEKLTSQDILRKSLMDKIDPDKLIYFKSSDYFKEFTQSSNNDSVVYYFNKIDSSYYKNKASSKDSAK